MTSDVTILDAEHRLLPALPQGHADSEAEAGANARLGWVVVVLFFGVFLGFASFFRLDAAANADGVVKVSGERQTVQHRAGGTVAALFVREGQQVKAGDVLILLAGAEVAANEQSLAAQVVDLMAERARLQAELNSSAAVIPPPEFATLPAEDKPLAEAALRQQIHQFQQNRVALTTQKRVVAQQAAQLQEKASGLGEQMGANRQEDSSYAAQLDGMRELAAQGYASVNRVRELERARQQMNGDFARLSADRASTRNQIGEMRMRSLSIDTDDRRQVAEDLRKTVDELNAALPKWEDARQQVENTRIRAPVGGQVVGLSIFTVGGVITPGEKLMSIVPSKATLVVEGHVQPTDANDLVVGQKAQVRFPGFHERSLPQIEGTVTRVSADAFTDDHTGKSYFTIEVTVPPADMAKLKPFAAGGLGLRPGLPATVLVPLRRRTLMGYLLEPLNQALWRSGREH